MHTLELKDQILHQMIRLEESKTDMLNAHFPLPSRVRERKEIEILLQRYVHRLEKLVISLNQEPDFRLTCVIIGSTVSIRSKQWNASETYRICYPDNSDIDTGCISFLSPLGRQLLLAPLYTDVKVELPDGEYEYVVEQISYP
ncbi:GreA/GreB family elongation factor [Paenibacillus soyae]|uniref:GreA/GreB family elongation factor n=1 Tax=Paenibacillus soyae TaxID=2969249 RepID=A0A9X2MPG2_9BACL|nr:GreA/GreB family elongation factor [Paenibacillus soyae]MCR2805798.1 GreA/GreB family elongation factor [Paenibacillus soyae]